MEENKKLLNLYNETGSHWKEISLHFKGRTDNTTKNQFFSLIRKALRKACKKIGRTSNTITINKMKPKVLSEFFKITVEIPSENPDQKHPRPVKVKQFIERFAFTKRQEVGCAASEEKEIEYIMNFLYTMKFPNKPELCREQEPEEEAGAGQQASRGERAQGCHLDPSRLREGEKNKKNQHCTTNSLVGPGERAGFPRSARRAGQVGEGPADLGKKQFQNVGREAHLQRFAARLRLQPPIRVGAVEDSNGKPPWQGGSEEPLQ